MAPLCAKFKMGFVLGLQDKAVLDAQSSYALGDLIASMAREIDAKQDFIEDLIAENNRLKVTMAGNDV